MKRQISTFFTGAFFASLLVVLSAYATAADEAKSNLTQVNGNVIQDANGNTAGIVMTDAGADKVSAESLSVVTENSDGSVSVGNMTVVTGKAEEIYDNEVVGEPEKIDSNWFKRFLSGFGLGDQANVTRKADDSKKYEFLTHDKYMLDLDKLAPQTIEEEMVVDDKGTRSVITKENAIEKAKTPVVRDKTKDKDTEKEAAFYEKILFDWEMNGGDPDEKIAVSIVFNSAPILDVIPAFADALGFNFVVDADVRMNVTLNLNSSMTRRELWEAFAILIENAGVGATVEGSLIRILPLNKFSTRSKLDINSKDGEILFYPLNYASAQEVIQQIRAFLSNSATCIQVTRPNAILLCDYKENIKKLKQMVEILDNNPKTKWPRVLIPCENVLPSKIATELRSILPTLGFVVKQLNDNNEAPGSIKIDSVDRLQLIVASAATQEAVQEIENWIAILDGTVSLDQERIFVHKVMYTKAEQLMQALSVLYNMTGTSLTIDDDGSSRTTNISGSGSNRSTSNNRNSSSDTYYVATTTDEKSNVFETPVKIFSDGALNRLVIRTTPRTYASIKALLDRLDVVPAQVLLQVTIAEVSIDNGFEFSTSVSGAGSWGGNYMGIGTNFSGFTPVSSSTTGETTDTPSIANTDGFQFMLADPNNPNNKYGYLRASASDNKFKVIACPQILVASNTEAMINVGKQTPYTGSSVTDTSSTSLLTTTSYKDSGITLTVTPQVTSTDLITLEIDQELSTASNVAVSSDVTAPELTTREVKTSMTIHNGQTMIIGGLIEEDTYDALNSLPIINEIPILKRLFGSTTAGFTRQEILILITGHILSEKSRVEDMISRYNDAIDAISEFEDNLGDSEDGKSKSGYQRMFFD